MTPKLALMASGIEYVDTVIGQICKTLSIGALCASLLILFILPGLLATFDKVVICKNKERKTRL